MSKSRLEKFLYALYSLDSSDLPTPLSRIEELYNCWVTGEETPTFKPLSRVEKYLMAILGVYDVNELPNPLSRVEVLLYKLATGDDSLEDFDTFLSEHEELLAEIIRNGGAGGNTDIEYVLYTLSTGYNTLYNTAEKPVKSAILKGQTSTGKNLYMGRDTSNTDHEWASYPITLEPNTYVMSNNGALRASTVINYETGDTIVTDSTFTITTQITVLLCGSVASRDKFQLEVGKEPTDYEPYCLVSVKMPVLTTRNKGFIGIDNSYFINSTPTNKSAFTYYEFSKIYENVTLNSTTSLPSIRLMYIDKDYIQKSISNADVKKMKLEVDSIRGIGFFGDGVSNGNKDVLVELLNNDSLNVWLEYKDIKTNILTCNEEVKLGGVGDVRDELDLVTGEVTQRIGEVVFDGSEDWVQSAYGNSTMFYTSFNNLVRKEYYLNSISCDKFVVHANESYLFNSTSPNGISAYADWEDTYPNENWIYIKCADSEGYVEKLKQWLSQNPITVQYELATESVKTVDLSVVDQDGNNTELSTFNDITHVTLSSEGLIPEAELEVATKNEEVLNTMSLEMDDIFTTQTTLGETVNTQSENVDATMIATTEIYEDLL